MGTAFREAKNVFRRNFIANELVGREEELACIDEFLTTQIKNRTNKKQSVGLSNVLYISGYPGTGKTALVESTCAQHSSQPSWTKNVKYIKLNCMSAEDPKRIYAMILNEIKPNADAPNPKTAQEMLENILLHEGSKSPKIM